MSKLSEYSKFDHLDDDDNDDDEKEEMMRDSQPQLEQVQNHPPISESASPQESVQQQRKPVVSEDAVVAVHRRHASIECRFQFEYNGAIIYEWEQSLSDVILYVPAPPPRLFPNARIHCEIAPHHLRLGLHGETRLFLDMPTFAAVDTAASTWCLEDKDDKNDDTNTKVIVVYLTKTAKGLLWSAPLTGTHCGEGLDAVSQQTVQKELMLERWQEENPGMDFRGAAFNGSVPDPRTYMGGINY